MSTDPDPDPIPDPAPAPAAPRARLSVEHSRGQVSPDDVAATRRVVVDLALADAQALATVIVGLPPGGPVLGPGTRRVPVPGGFVEVTIDPTPSER